MEPYYWISNLEAKQCFTTFRLKCKQSGEKMREVANNSQTQNELIDKEWYFAHYFFFEFLAIFVFKWANT